MALSIIGAGFGRTGTLSLRTALEQLGLGPCYHMSEVFERPEDIEVWNRVAAGDPVDWEALFVGYRSAVDWPVCAYYRQLAEHYPQAKVILTVRDPERWYRSAIETIFPVMTGSPIGNDAVGHAQAAMARKIILEQTFGERVNDREHVLAVYERHIEEVKRTIPPERLLVYQVAEGWEPLCRFLDRPVPAEPFPQVNTTEEFQQMIAARREAS